MDSWKCPGRDILILIPNCKLCLDVMENLSRATHSSSYGRRPPNQAKDDMVKTTVNAGTQIDSCQLLLGYHTDANNNRSYYYF